MKVYHGSTLEIRVPDFYVTRFCASPVQMTSWRCAPSVSLPPSCNLCNPTG